LIVARFVFPVVITAIIVFVVSGVVTFFSIGWRHDFVIRWCSAFSRPLRPQPHPTHRRRHRKNRLVILNTVAEHGIRFLRTSECV
jgi:hypothetical protein